MRTIAAARYDKKTMPRSTRSPLAQLRNVGPAALRDFDLLGIRTQKQLAAQEPLALYRRLERKSGQRQDPCVLDVFMATIHQARTGEALNWWTFTPRRKALHDNLTKSLR
jgi:hypothetical protein